VQNVSFNVRRGEALGIIGRNGAGKSTILKLLTGIMRPTMGSIRVAGRISSLIEVTGGFHGELTGRENVYLYGTILGMKRDQIRRRFDEIVAFSEIEESIDTPVKRYSSGMFARLGFAVAAHVEPDVLMVDEVLSVGDYLFKQKCVERMNAVRASGATVIFVSHNLREVANLCQQSLLLDQGKVQMIGPTEEVIKNYYERGQEWRAVNTDKAILIRQVKLCGKRGSQLEFESGDKLYLSVEVDARTAHNDVSVVIQIVDDHQYPVFETCTYRLGAGAIKFDCEQTLTCTFELDLCLAAGKFHVNVFLYRYVTSQEYDRWITAKTFFITGAPEVRGLVTLHPKLGECLLRNSNGTATSEPSMSPALHE
jgi:lipopolysaccharide transport system ATP-binding protein